MFKDVFRFSKSKVAHDEEGPFKNNPQISPGTVRCLEPYTRLSWEVVTPGENYLDFRAQACGHGLSPAAFVNIKFLICHYFCYRFLLRLIRKLFQLLSVSLISVAEKKWWNLPRHREWGPGSLFI